MRAHERAVRAAGEAAIDEQLASFSPKDVLDEMTDEEFDRLEREFNLEGPDPVAGRPARVDLVNLGGRVDVPLTVGKRR